MFLRNESKMFNPEEIVESCKLEEMAELMVEHMKIFDDICVSRYQKFQL